MANNPSVLDIGSRFRTVDATVPIIPFDAGNQRSVELPRSFLYRSIAIRLTGALNSGGAGAYTLLGGADTPLNLIKKVELIADGRKVIWTGAARDLFRLAHIFKGKQGELNPPSAVANQANAFSATIIVDNAAMRMQMPADSLFDPREFEKIELRVTWGLLTDLATGGTATVFSTTPQIEINVMETLVGVQHIGFNRIIQFDEQTISAASTNFTFNVPRSGLLAGVLLRTDATVAGSPAPVDTVINFVSVRSDNSFNHKDRISWNMMKARNLQDFQLDLGQPTALATLGSNFGFLTGYAYYDFTEDGLMSSAINALALNVLQLILDVNAPAGALVRATYLFFEPIRPVTG